MDKFQIPEKIFVYDVTLRDGEQASGFHMYPHEKLAIANQLAEIGVDGIEAGFAISSPGDFESIQQIAKEVGTKNGPVISSLAMAKDDSIEAAANAIKPAYNQRIHTFIATSQIHRETKLRKSEKEIIDMAMKSVKKAKSYVDDVEFSCEDFGRTDLDYIVDIVCAVTESGATTVNLPDTVGWLFPHESYDRFEYVIKEVNKRGYFPIFSVHNHNDFGMGTATTVMAVLAGARQVECTINGIGERAGNTSLEEVVASLKTRRFADFNINTKLIGETSRLISECTGVTPQPNKSIVGRNAFAHEAGIHQDGMIKDRNTYEIMDPADYGVESIITFGPRSGRNALREKYKSLGIILDNTTFQRASEKFNSIADKVKETDDADIVYSTTEDDAIPERYRFVGYKPFKDNENTYSVIIEMEVNGKIKKNKGVGDGLIDAGVKAVNKVIRKRQNNIVYFASSAESEGSDAIGDTRLEIKNNGLKVIGKSKDTDVVASALKAYIIGCNRMAYTEDYFVKR